MEEQILSLRKDEIIFRDGEYKNSCMYDILQGKVGVYKNYGSPDEIKLTELSAGSVVGELCMLEGYPRSATAVALEEGTKLQVVTAANFGEYFRGHEDKVFAIMQQISQRIRELTVDYTEVCHTLSESISANNIGKEKSGWLRSSLKKFADIYANWRK